MAPEDRWPFPDQLGPRKKEAMLKWRLLTVEVEGVWRDDSEACYGLRVMYSDVDDVAAPIRTFRVSVWWLSEEGTLMLFKATARRPKYLRELQVLIREQLESGEAAADYMDEEGK